MRVRLDEASLKTIANLTQGEYFYAGTANDLKKVYETLNSKLVLEKRKPRSPRCLPPLPAIAISRHFFRCCGSTAFSERPAGRALSSAFFLRCDRSRINRDVERQAPPRLRSASLR